MSTEKRCHATDQIPLKSMAPHANVTPRPSLPADDSFSHQAQSRHAYHRLPSADDTAVEFNAQADVLFQDPHADNLVIGLGISRSLNNTKKPKEVSVDSYSEAAPSARSAPPIGNFDQVTSHFRSPSGVSASSVDSPRHIADAGRGAQVSLLGSSAHNSSFNQERYETASRPGSQSGHEFTFHPPHACPSTKPFYQVGWSWLTVSLVILTIFSTAFSAIFLVIAMTGKRWGDRIRTNGTLTPSQAGTLTNVLAKAIEVSFVAVVVTFLGQVLSRRAFNKVQGRGVTLAEFSMRSWILQPGSMFTHPHSVKYGALSILGIISVIATILATMYTTAAQALVQPQLKYSSWEFKRMRGLVRTSFSNAAYIVSHCETPISMASDEESARTCFDIQTAGQSYQNYHRYLSIWTHMVSEGNRTTDPFSRPPGFGVMYDNTTITAPWVDIHPPVFEAGRIITNHSLAYPHAGIYRAARDPVNAILQPQELDGLGLYGVKAAVASPVANAFCVQTADQFDLAPLVYETWDPDFEIDRFNGSTWPTQIVNVTADVFQNTTALDSVFQWGQDNVTRPRPIFPRFPLPFDTLLNNSRGGVYGRDSIYLLGQGGGARIGQYIICEMSVSITPNCSTHYNATASGGSIEAVCSNTTTGSRHIDSDQDALQGDITRSKDWFDVGSSWAASIALGTGISGGKGSNSRLLMQLLLDNPTSGAPAQLPMARPSVAEALAVLAGSTLMYSTLDAPFDTRQWNYSSNPLSQGRYEDFDAHVRGQEYASGGVGSASSGFLIVLILTFTFNASMLIYFLWQRGLVSDFSQPPNLFALAINSPPSHLLTGSCGAGPHGDQYNVNWSLQIENDHLYMEGEAKPKAYAHGEMKSPVVTVDGEELNRWEVRTRRNSIG